jgi:hypothetical protein
VLLTPTNSVTPRCVEGAPQAALFLGILLLALLLLWQTPFLKTKEEDKRRRQKKKTKEEDKRRRQGNGCLFFQ